jgi:hypothetical protein
VSQQTKKKDKAQKEKRKERYIMSPKWSNLFLTSNVLWKDKKKKRQYTQTLNLTFLKVTVSTLNPTVGIVDTFCPDFSLKRIAGRKKIKGRIMKMKWAWKQN